MNKILQKLYEGQIAPFTSEDFKPSIFQKRREQCFAKHQLWLDQLETHDPDTYSHVMALLDDQFALQLDNLPETFCEGFTIGANIMLEVLTSSSV